MSAAIGKHGPVPTQFSSEEWQARCDLAACYRLIDMYGWSDFFGTHISLRIPGTDEFLLNPFGMLFEEITASSLIKVDQDGNGQIEYSEFLAHALTIITTNAKIKVGSRGWLVLYPSPLFPSRAAFWPLLAGFEARQPLLNPWQGQGRKKKPTTETTSRTTAPTSRGPRRWGGNPATPTASSGHPPTRKTDFLLALTFSARHAALLVVLAVQLALVVVVGAARATAPVADPGWVPGLVSRLDGQHEVLGEAGLLCRRR